MPTYKEKIFKEGKKKGIENKERKKRDKKH